MTFQLVFEGRMVAEERQADVEVRLASLLMIDLEKVQELFEQAPTVIKKDLERSAARRYQTAFEKTGALCEIVPMPDDLDEIGPTGQTVGLAPAPPLIRPESASSDPEPFPAAALPTPPAPALEIGQERSLGGMLLPSLAMLAIAAFMAWRAVPVSYGAGAVAPDDPIQTRLDSPPTFPHKTYTVHPKASFAVEARVLSTERYRFDNGADLVPWDFALGWGPMSDEEVIDKLKIRQGARFYTWSAREFPISRGDIEVHSANMHLIPANSSVQRRMGKARRGHIVSFSGYLVTATKDNGWKWKTSMTRDDTGAGACELVFVESFEIR